MKTVMRRGRIQRWSLQLRHWFYRAAAIGIALLVFATSSTVGAEPPLRIGMSDDYPPFNFRNSSGVMAGFNVDIAAALCAQLDRRCTIVEVPWSQLIGAVEDGRIDAIVSSMVATPARRERLAFTAKYYDLPTFFLGRPTDIRRLEQNRAGFTGSVGVLRESQHAVDLAVILPRATMVPFDKLPQAFAALETGDLALVFSGGGAVYAWVQARDDRFAVSVRPRLPGKDSTSGAMIAVRKDNEALRAAFDGALARLLASPAYAEIAARYFPFPIY